MKNQNYSFLEMPDPEPWPEPVDGQVLLDQLAGTLGRMAVLPRWAPEALALFSPHTYAFKLREVSTYVGVESPEKRCGKTTLLGVLGKLVSRPIMAANISSSAFFRVIEEMQPTLLIDEADTFLKKRGELRGILNAGYTKETGFVMRVAPEMKRADCRVESEEHGGNGASERQNTGSRLVRFSCWCPKVMASIGHLPETLADRCIRIRMQRKTPHEQCQRLRDLDPTLITTLRRQCVRFVADHALEIANARPTMPSGLNDREADLWEPLIVIGDLAGGRWRELARQAAVGLTESAREHNPIGSLLLDIWVIFLNAGVDRMFSRTLAACLNDLGDRRWAELKKAKVVDTLWLAKILHPYDTRSRTIWMGDLHAKGYLKKDLEVLFHRYIPRSEIDALLAESAAEKAGDGDRKSDPPSSDSGAARDGEEKKDEPGEAQGGEAAAA